MAKYPCPSCEKRFDFEKNGWICPFCGAVVLQDMEEQAHIREQQRQEQKKQNKQKEHRQKTVSREIKWETKREIKPNPPQEEQAGFKTLLRLARVVSVVVCVALCAGVVLLPKLKEAYRAYQTEEMAWTEATASCGETVSIQSLELVVNGAMWADEMPEFPEEIRPPETGRLLAVSYTFAEQAAEDAPEPEDAMWACLDTGTGAYVLPRYSSTLTGSDTLRSELYSLGMVGINLDGDGSLLLFLVQEDTVLADTALRVYHGTPKEYHAMEDRSAEGCVVIPLEVMS